MADTRADSTPTSERVPTAAPTAARWVWVRSDEPERNVFHWFRTGLDVASPGGHVLRIAADSRYRLYVNGTLVGDGPPMSPPSMPYLDSHDLTSLLQSGRNTIAIIGRHTGIEPGRRGGLLVEVTSPDGTVLAATGTPGWRCRRGDAWTADTYAVRINRFDPFQEWFDARAEPEGWAGGGFDVSAWDEPVVIDGPWAAPLARDIPRPRLSTRFATSIDAVEECTAIASRDRPGDLSLLVSMPGLPVRFSHVGDVAALLTAGGTTDLASSSPDPDGAPIDGVREPCVTLDFGRVITAYVELDVEGAAGTSIDIGVAERLTDERFTNLFEGQFSWRYVLRDGRQTWRSFAWRAFRFLRIRVSAAAAPLRIHELRAVETGYPFIEASAFTSADATLDAVFAICRRTLELCCNEAIVDTPWREQSQWLGDAAGVTGPGLYACFGESALQAKFLRQSAASQLPSGLLANVTDVVPGSGMRPIPDFSLWWVIALWRHYEWTGEVGWLTDHATVVDGILDGHLEHLTPDGLVDVPAWVFVDWADLDKDGANAAHNAILVGALDTAARMADAVDDADRAARHRASSAALRAAFGALLDGRSGLYVDALRAGTPSTRFSEQTNAAAIQSGIADPERADHIIRRFFVDRDVEATESQPFFTAVSLRALAASGRRDLALDVVRERWGRRFVDRGLTSCAEEWTVNGSFREGTYQPIMRTLSHAWSAHPAEFLLRELLGFDVLEPGCRRVRIDPYLDLDYEAVSATPFGPVTVRVRDGAATIEAPDDVDVVPGSPE